MRLKGVDALQAHVPELNKPGRLLQAPQTIGRAFLLTTLFFLAADHYFAEWMPDGEIVVLALGFLIFSRFFSQRAAYRRRYCALAYQNAFARFCAPGLGIIMASIVHLAYISGPDIPQIWWRALLIDAGILSALTGVALWFRSAAALGFDKLVMLYVYYPAEGERATAPIYGLLRHPIYSATLAVGFGLALIHANWYALLVAVLLPIFFLGWIRLVEEPELMERFPDYAEYRKRVPAFIPRPSDFGKFIRWLVKGTS